MSNTQESPLARFQALLRELFQFDCADLDFGIYRIMNHKRDVVERFITTKLPETIDKELDSGTLARQAQANAAMERAREQVEKTLGTDAIDPAGNVAPALAETPVAQTYLDAKARAAGTRSRAALEADTYNHLHTFFGRYYQDGDFVSKRRYSSNHRYAIPYNGEEVYLHWANSDQYYIKTAEHFHSYQWKSPTGVTVHFRVDSADVEQNNVKGDRRFFVPRTADADWDATSRTLTLPFTYRPLSGTEKASYGRSNQQDKIIAAALEELPRRFKGPDALATLTSERRRRADNEPITHLEHHLLQYTRLVVPRLDAERDFAKEVEHVLDPQPGVSVSVDLAGRAEAITSGDVMAVQEASSGTEGSIPTGALDLVDWNAAYLAVIDHLARRGFRNLAASPAGIRRVIESPSTYSLIAEERLTNPTKLEDMVDLQQAAIAILRKYADGCHSVHLRRWESKHMRYLPLDEHDRNLSFRAQEGEVPSYIVTGPPHQVVLIEEIQRLAETDAIYDSETSDLPRIHFDRHLYQPLLIEQARGGPPSELKSTPPQLNASETRFVEDLRAYWADSQERNPADTKQVFLLRNLSRGMGVGFFEECGFYPDFILWIKDGDAQRIVFIEPHGMMHARAYAKDDKARLHERLPVLEEAMELPPGVTSVRLDSFIVSATPYEELHPRYGDGLWTRDQFAEKHILFQEDRGTSGYDYIAAIFQRSS